MTFFSITRAPGMPSPIVDSAPAAVVDVEPAYGIELTDSRSSA